MVFLGIDLGTSSVKVLATDSRNRLLGEATREYPVDYPREKWAQQDPEHWWQGTVEAIRELVHRLDIPKDGVRAIGFSGQMHGLVALDGDGRVLTPSILWCDQRTQAECDAITAHFGPEGLGEATGNKALTGFTAPKILWVRRNLPEVFAKMAHILLPKDYLRLRLTGVYATDVSDASGMLLLDVKNRCWSEEMLRFLGITEAQLPELYESYAVTGVVSQAALEALGLEGEILVAGGAGDQAAGAVGTGTVEDGVVSVTLGTSGVVFAAHERFAMDGEQRLHAFCHANGKYHSMGVMLSAASSLNWWAESVHPAVGFETLLEEASHAPAGSGRVFFLPYLMGERTPYADPDATGTFAGLTMGTSRGEMTRAVLEGVAFGLLDSLNILRELDIPIREIRVIGGGARSRLWRQILADVFGQPVQEINTHQGGALGAAILAAVAAGHFREVAEGCRALVSVTDTVMPDPAASARYQALYPLYRSLYADLSAWYARRAALGEGV